MGPMALTNEEAGELSAAAYRAYAISQDSRREWTAEEFRAVIDFRLRMYARDSCERNYELLCEVDSDFNRRFGPAPGASLFDRWLQKIAR